MMTPEEARRMNGIGAITNSALYLGALVLAGLWAGDKLVVSLAIAAAGLAFVAYCFQMVRVGSRIAIATSLVNNALGVCAGLALLVRYWA